MPTESLWDSQYEMIRYMTQGLIQIWVSWRRKFSFKLPNDWTPGCKLKTTQTNPQILTLSLKWLVGEAIMFLGGLIINALKLQLTDR